MRQALAKILNFVAFTIFKRMTLLAPRIGNFLAQQTSSIPGVAARATFGESFPKQQAVKRRVAGIFSAQQTTVAFRGGSLDTYLASATTVSRKWTV